MKQRESGGSQALWGRILEMRTVDLLFVREVVSKEITPF